MGDEHRTRVRPLLGARARSCLGVRTDRVERTLRSPRRVCPAPPRGAGHTGPPPANVMPDAHTWEPAGGGGCPPRTATAAGFSYHRMACPPHALPCRPLPSRDGTPRRTSGARTVSRRLPKPMTKGARARKYAMRRMPNGTVCLPAPCARGVPSRGNGRVGCPVSPLSSSVQNRHFVEAQDRKSVV